MAQVRTSGISISEVGSAYVYAILIEGIVRYIGKGRNGRMYAHLIEAKRSAARCRARTTQLSPRMHRRLVEAVRSGADIKAKIIVGGLTDRDAYRIEGRLIAAFHKFRTDQLWNTIDERFLDPRWLPEKWRDPENAVYRLPRPLAVISRGAGAAAAPAMTNRPRAARWRIGARASISKSGGRSSNNWRAPSLPGSRPRPSVVRPSHRPG